MTKENVNLRCTFEKEDSKLVLMLASSKENKKHILYHMAPNT